MGTRLQIRDDIRKMRNPKMHEIKNILRGIGLEQFVNHKAYIQTATHHQINYNLYNDDDVQFISQPPTKHRKKKKKKHRDYDYHGHHINASPSNSVFSISSDPANINNNKRTVINIDHHIQPQKKKQKLSVTNNGSQEAIKCDQCNKIFTLEVDLLLHRTNDKCVKC